MEKPINIDMLQEMLWSFAEHRTITVAARTGVLERLARDPVSSDELADELGLDPLATGKVVRALVSLGLAERSGDRFTITDALRSSFSAGEQNLVPFLLHHHQMYNRWGENLEAWLRGESWSVQRRGPPDARRFGEAMQAMGAHVARSLTQRLGLDGVERVLDVGGSLGHYARAFCRAQPELSVTVLDIPEVAEIGREQLSGGEFDGRIDYIAGNYLETDLGEGYDLVLMANVLHQERPDRAADLVRRGAAALAPGGRLLVLDFAIDDDGCGPRSGTLFAINMRSFGDTHGERDISGWMTDAGLVHIGRLDLTEARWVIIGCKPSTD